MESSRLVLACGWLLSAPEIELEGSRSAFWEQIGQCQNCFNMAVEEGVEFIVWSQLWPKAKCQINIRVFIALVSGFYLCIRASKIDLITVSLKKSVRCEQIGGGVGRRNLGNATKKPSYLLMKVLWWYARHLHSNELFNLCLSHLKSGDNLSCFPVPELERSIFPG